MTRMVLVLLGTQLLYSASDFMGCYYIRRGGFCLANFLTAWFWIYQLVRQIAMLGQLYVLSQIELGRTMAMLGAVSIVISNLLGYALLKEVLSVWAYAGVGLSVLAFLLMAVR